MGTPSPFASVEAIADLALRLIAIPSLSGDEAAVAAVLTDVMTGLGYEVQTDDFGSVVGLLEFGPGPTILFDTHLDTVPVADADQWTRDPGGEQVDGRVYGRGAVDMKGPLAACVLGIAALRGHHRAGRVVVSGTVAEECVEGPALVRVAKDIAPDAVVICEPSSARLVVGQRGRAEVSVEIHGSSSHSAYPDAGRNAAEAMADVIVALRTLTFSTHPLLGPGLLVLTDVVSRPYPSLSVVPDRCMATFDRRTLPGETADDVLLPIRNVAGEVAAAHGVRIEVAIAVDDLTTYTGSKLRAGNFAPAWITAPESKLVAAALGGLRAADVQTGISHYAFCTNGSGSAGTLGIPTLGFGPGQEHAAHTTDESITLDELATGACGYAALAQALTALSRGELGATPVEFDRSELSG